MDKLENTEILGILEHRIQKSCQKGMTDQGFEQVMEVTKKFIDFRCRMESCELDHQDDQKLSFQESPAVTVESKCKHKKFT